MSQNHSPQSDRKYWAFISYSHSDTKETAWLHKALENYKVPGYLIGTETRTGVVPRRIFPVFRDRDELPTSSDLGGNLHAALRNSRYLVVVCSPRSAKSIWVDAEVNYFKKHHGGNNVLCLVVDGVPGGDEDSECFCPSLRVKIGPEGGLTDEPVEPIAADMREGKDGRRRAFLKIAAGILGVDFDTLYQRDKKRRRNRLIALSSAALVGLAMLAVFYTRLEKVAKSQSDMASQVQKMQQTKFREFGSLPKERAAQLGKIIADSGVLDAEQSMEKALSNEKIRFDIYNKRAQEFVRKRSILLGSIESFLDKVRPDAGWDEAVDVFSMLNTRSIMDDASSLDSLATDYNIAKTFADSAMQKEFSVWQNVIESSKKFAENMNEAVSLFHEMDELLGALPLDFELQISESRDLWNPSMTRVTALNYCAWLLATDAEPTRRDASKSVYYARKALEMGGNNNAGLLDTLAASLALNGNFEEAAKIAQDAIDNAKNYPPHEVEQFYNRMKLYEQKKFFVENKSHGAESEEIVKCVANEFGIDAWCLQQRMNISALEPLLLQFPSNPEEKLVVESEIQKLKENQIKFESTALARMGELLKGYYANLERPKADESPNDYVPLENKQGREGIVTTSVKIWRKPSDAPERGSMREHVDTIIEPGGTRNVVVVDREGSAELYCIKRFAFTSSDNSRIDTRAMMTAKLFARKAADFLSVHIP
jgi:tetratricopeptide (TPR) repeat protein